MTIGELKTIQEYASNNKIYMRQYSSEVCAFLDNNLHASVLLNQILYWTERTSNNDGWFYKSNAEFQTELAYSRRSLDSSKKFLVEKNLITIKISKIKNGNTAVFYCANFKAIYDMLQQIVVCRKSPECCKSTFRNVQKEPLESTICTIGNVQNVHSLINIEYNTKNTSKEYKYSLEKVSKIEKNIKDIKNIKETTETTEQPLILEPLIAKNKKDLLQESLNTYSTKVKKNLYAKNSVTVNEFIAIHDMLLKDYGYKNGLPVTPAVRKQIKNVIAQVKSISLHPFKLLEFSIKNWALIKKEYAWYNPVKISPYPSLPAVVSNSVVEYSLMNLSLPATEIPDWLQELKDRGF